MKMTRFATCSFVPWLLLLVLLTPAALPCTAMAADAMQGEVQVIGGVVRPAVRALISFAQQGLILMLPREGQLVKKGQLIARLDEREPRAKLQNAVVNVEAAEAGLAEVIHDRDVQKGLLKDDIITEEQFRNLHFAVEYNQIKVKGARAALLSAKLNLDNCQLNAPFTGVVVKVEANVGEWAGKGKPVIELASTEVLELPTDIPLPLTRTLAPGTQTTLTDSGEVVGTARVKTLLPLLDPASGLRRVIWEVTPESDVLAGRYVTLEPWWAAKPQ